ncbi:hypothetical protein SAMN06265339_1298 [Desulfurobacterium pacificum]|uniref:Uncharacterized protein n=1 Tax=Desulfurobacterium pacificum TaxID=240166 RepID=A0ABY1NNT1_9BACT|nr:hypothetical protein [Desulfurobacterium pacificum]SMP14240.1 hypothetical protein SAMN06265339_1298 [Desulfurobacterium pacificum]
MRKALALPLILAIVFILFLLSGAVLKVVTTNTSSTAVTKDSIVALNAAESGAEEALAKIKSGAISSFPAQLNGEINGATYNVTIDRTVDGYYVVSTGTKGEAVRKVEVNLGKAGLDFYPFAVNGNFDINDLSSVGSGDWSDAVVAVKSISNSLKSDLEKLGFDVYIQNNLDLPKVADLDVSKFYPPENECDYGDYNTNEVYKSDFVDKNGDGKIVVCGKNITLDDSLIYFYNDIIIAAKGDIYFTRNTTLKKKVGSTSNLSLVAEGKMEFDLNSNIDFSGADEGYNILLYAKEGIYSDDKTGQWISISGNQNTENTSNVFILTPEKIEVNRDLIDDTATTKKDVNFLLWADKGIASSNGGFDISGSSKTVRNFSIIVPEGNATFDRWQFTGSEDRSGLSYKDIEKYCENDTSIPDFYRSIYCQLKDMIDKSSSGGFVVINWKVY